MGTVAQLPAVDGRTLHLVDLENLIGDPYAKGRMVTEALACYLHAAAWRPGDLVYVASCPPVIAEIGFASPVPCRLFAARGEDGADLQLLAHAPPELVRRRVERLVIGSGDHIFAPRALAALEAGVSVGIVSRPEALSGRLVAIGAPVALMTGVGQDREASGVSRAA